MGWFGCLKETPKARGWHWHEGHRWSTEAISNDEWTVAATHAGAADRLRAIESLGFCIQVFGADQVAADRVLFIVRKWGRWKIMEDP